MRILLLICLLGSALVLAACSSGSNDISQPSFTVPGRTAAPTAAASVTPTPDTSTPFFAALADPRELAPTQALTETTLLYAYKVGKHVTVLRRDISTGTEQVVLEYDEPHEAKHEGNTWEEMVPSIGLETDTGRLVYASDPNVMAFDLKAGTSTTILQRALGVTAAATGQLIREAWTTPTGIELCCGYTLASVSVGPTGRAVVQMTQYEGSTLAWFATDGSDACQVSDQTSPFFGGAQPDWNGAGDAVSANAGGLGKPGVNILSATDPCTAQTVVSDTAYQDAAWSSDGQLITAAKSTGSRSSAIVVLSRDGATVETLVDDQGINFSPVFSPDGSNVYYARAASTKEDGSVAKWGVSVAERGSQGSEEFVILPEGWTARPKGWTDEGYLVLQMTYGCEPFFLGCGSRLAVVDVDGGLIYLSAQRDFTNFLGFAP